MLDLLGIGRLWKMLEDVARSEEEERTMQIRYFIDYKSQFKIQS